MVRRWLKRLASNSEVLLPLRRFRIERQAASSHPDWSQLLAGDAAAWQKAREAARGGPKILIGTSVGLHSGMTSIESLLAVALTLRGADVSILLCDGALPACMACQSDWYPDGQRFLREGPARDLCSPCFRFAKGAYERLGLNVVRYSDLLTTEDRAEASGIAASIPADNISNYLEDRQKVGQHALAGALRFFARGDLRGEPFGEQALRRFFEASLLTSRGCSRLFAGGNFSAAVFHHGIYVPQGVLGEAARRHAVPVVNWVPAYRSGTFIFSHGRTYHHEMMDEPVEAWEDLDWTPAAEQEIMAYLDSRATGTQDWIRFHQHAVVDAEDIRAATGFTADKPVIGLLTNVIWDAQLHYPRNVFPSMMDWVRRTVTWFAGRPDLQLLIRVHPAELTGNLVSRQRVVDELAASFDALPGNVRVIGPESPISTYAAMSSCRAVLIYGTKAGVELAARGATVVAAGEAWVRNKGITLDPIDEAEYFSMLSRLPELAPPPDSRDRARRYAYHYFFRRMIPLEHTKPKRGHPPYRLSFTGGLSTLLPGRSLGLDVVCNGILHRTPFIFPAGRSVHGTG